jgi:hypothetical protein
MDANGPCLSLKEPVQTWWNWIDIQPVNPFTLGLQSAASNLGCEPTFLELVRFGWRAFPGQRPEFLNWLIFKHRGYLEWSP